MNEEKAIKKFFLQRSILDTLRVYIELSEDFLTLMEEHGLLDEDDITIVKGLRWPSNRNELLQILIKKPWRRVTFDKFSAVLRATQPANLTKMVVEKSSEFITRELEAAEDIIGAELDNELESARSSNGLNLQAKNAIKMLIKERETEIQQLRAEVEDLHSNLKSIVEERNHLKEEFGKMDSVLTDWLAAMQLNADHELVSDALDEIKAKLLTQESTLATLNGEKLSLERSVVELRDKLSIMTTENIAVKEANEELTKRLQSVEKMSEEKAAAYEVDIQKLRDINSKLEQNLNMFQSRSIESTRATDVELSSLKQKLNDVTKQLAAVVKERDEARQELNDVSAKTRKLLFTLDIANQSENLSLSLDHARNMTYAKRRRNSMQPSGNQLQELAALSELDASNTASAISTKLVSLSDESRSQTPTQTPRSAQKSRRGSLPGTTKTLPITSSLDRGDEGIFKCRKCSKIYNEASNFDGACVFHAEEAVKLNEGTELEVWSCCKTLDKQRGCQKSRHQPSSDSVS